LCAKKAGGSEVQRCRGAEVLQRCCSDAEMQRCRGEEVLVHGCWCRSAGVGVLVQRRRSCRVAVVQILRC